MKVIILGAGQGRRLLPLTADVPKALLDIGGKTLIERQIEAFAACNIREFVVVTGYASDRLERVLARMASDMAVSIETIFNPFYAVADNLASCWMARHAMTGDFVQVNGDNVFTSELAALVLAAPPADVTVAINHKAAYDADDMKVMLDGQRVTEIGKGLPVEAVDAEAIGFYVFRNDGAARYVEILEQAMRSPLALKQWFPSAISELAKRIDIRAVAADGVIWCEVDFPVDLLQARKMVAGW